MALTFSALSYFFYSMSWGGLGLDLATLLLGDYFLAYCPLPVDMTSSSGFFFSSSEIYSLNCF